MFDPDSFARDMVAHAKMAAQKPQLSLELKYLMFSAQDGLCGICGKTMYFNEATADHVWPRSSGYALEKNAVLTHKHCNEGKASMPPSEFEILFLRKVNLALGYLV